jgi:hypothetical protein
VGKLLKKLADWDTGKKDPGSRASDKDPLHSALPFLIVASTLGFVAMGWQASVTDERATRKDEVSRQDLVRLAQLKLQKVQEVDSDIRVFGELERHRLLANQLRRDADRARAGDRQGLVQAERAERGLAEALAPELKYFPGDSALRGEPYNARTAQTLAETGDDEMASLEPNELRSAAHEQRQRGLHLTGLAVLFVVGLVLFTIAAVTSGKTARGLAAVGAVFSICALALFPSVRWF